MKKFSTSMVMILVGAAIFLLGCIQPARYENAKENGYEVEATIVEVKVRIEDDAESGYTSTSYTVYGDYELDGEKYEHVKLGKYYDTDEYYVGKTMKVVVDPDDPDSPMFEGGVLCVIGFVVAGIGIIGTIRKKKQANQSAQNG